MPFANPHLLSIFREAEGRQSIDLSVYVFRDLPSQRLSLGWSTPDDVNFLSFGWRRIQKFLGALTRSDDVVFLGILDPKFLMLITILVCRMIAKKVWIASEGFKVQGQRFPAIVRMILNHEEISILAIGYRSSNDYRAAGLVRPKYYRFGFAEKYTQVARDCGATKQGPKYQSNLIRLLGVGQLNSRKNFESVIEGLFCVQTSHLVELRICGEGPNADGLKQLATQLPPNISLCLLGKGDAAMLDREFGSADVFVMPSRYDGWGVVLNQAVAYGLPCLVSSGVRAARDHLMEHGRNGFIYDEGTISSYLEALINDDAVRTRFSEESRQFSEQWSVEAISDRLVHLFNDSTTRFDSGPLERVTD